MIEMGKKYRTRSGLAWETFCIDFRGTRPVAGRVTKHDGNQEIHYLNADGRVWPDQDSPVDLIEISPYEGWPIDAPVWVGSGSATLWWPRYFAGMSQDGDIYAWESGGTSFSSNRKISWREARLASEFTPTAEERGDD